MPVHLRVGLAFLLLATVVVLVLLSRPVCQPGDGFEDGFAATGGAHVALAFGAVVGLIVAVRRRGPPAGALAAAIIIGGGAYLARWTFPHATCHLEGNLPADCPGLMCIFARRSPGSDIPYTDDRLMLAFLVTLILAAVLALACVADLIAHRGDRARR